MSRKLSASLSSAETINGFVYFALHLLILPSILGWINGRLLHPLSSAELNFVYYIVNFIAILLLLHDFLGRSMFQAVHHPALLCQAVILGLAAYFACRWAIQSLIRLLLPSFQNYNDESIAALSRSNYFLMVLGTVILVPPVEECFYRGLIFRNLYSKSRWVAYAVSMAAFAIVHIVGYLGVYEPLALLLAILQYLPAGLCLAWSYTKADTIFAPILVHSLINYLTIRTMR